MTIAYRSAGANCSWAYNNAFGLPPGYQANDLLIILATASDEAAVSWASGNDGWTQFIDHQAYDTLRMLGWWKYAASTSEATPKLNYVGHDGGCCGKMYAFTVDTIVANPISVIGTFTDTPLNGANPQSFASITTLANNDMLLGCYASAMWPTWRITAIISTPLSAFAAEASSWNGNNGLSQLAWGVRESTGATGTFNVTVNVGGGGAEQSTVLVAFTETESGEPPATSPRFLFWKRI